MKKLFNRMLAVLILSVGLMTSTSFEGKAQMDESVSYQTFYDELSPYGDWIYDPDYGYVWSPDAGNDFRPYYTNGRWAMTDYGNTWVSNYSWGWAPFHYGRWTYNRYYGWVWIPDTVWGPAWVSWRYGGGNYGWAPMGPGINIHLSFGGGYYVPYNWWTFVPCNHIYGGYYNNYWRGTSYNHTYINNTTIINNTYNNTYVYGPRKSEVEKVTGNKVNVYNIRNNRNSGAATIQGDQLNIYRPSVRNTTGIKEAPQDFVRSGERKSIRTASPELTGTAGAKRSQREMSSPAARNERSPRMQRITDRNEMMNENRNDNNRTPTAREDASQPATPIDRRLRYTRDRQVRPMNQEDNGTRPDRTHQDQQRIQDREMRQQRMQRERMQQDQERQQEMEIRQQRMQQERVRHDQQRAQEMEIRQQRIQQENNYREQQRAYEMNARQQRMQQERMKRQESRPMQAAPQREWRRPEPQRMEHSAPPMQRQMSPSERGGFHGGGRR